MSQTTASGAGGSVAPGWYTDPHDASQLRWWSGEGWTDHVSGGAVAQPIAAQPVVAEPVAAPVAAAQPVAEAYVPAVVPPLQASDALPSRRALREPSADAGVDSAAAASEAAEAALRAHQALLAQQAQDAQAQQLQAQQAQAEQAGQFQAQQDAQLAAQQLQAQQLQAQQFQATPVQSAPVQSAPVQSAPVQSAPVSPETYAPPLQQGSAPVPTLPVQPKSFLEQAGYAPLEATPSAPTAGQPVPGQPVAAQPLQAEPVPAQPVAVQPAQTLPPQAPPQAPQPVQPLQANAWDQAAAQVGQLDGLAAAQSQWNQQQQAAPQVSAAQAPAVQQGWGAPGTVPPLAPTAAPLGAPPVGTPGGGIDSLFGGAPASAPDAAGGWGLSPSGADDAPATSRRRGGAPDAAAQTAGSSTLWAWLIAISPILAAGSIGYVIAATGYDLSNWPLKAAIAAPYLLVLLFAIADRAGLTALGHNEPRSPGWALLSAPVYLIMRAGETRREDGSGTTLTLIWFFSFLVAIGGFVGYGFIIGHPLIPGLPS